MTKQNCIFKLLADFYHVSTDYLLGRIEEKTLDNHYICNYTGLSEQAIESLLNNKYDVSLLSSLLETSIFWKAINTMKEMRGDKKLVEKSLSMISESKSEEDRKKAFDVFLTTFPYLSDCKFRLQNSLVESSEAVIPTKDLIDTCYEIYSAI